MKLVPIILTGGLAITLLFSWISLGVPDWIHSDSIKQGLWRQCVDGAGTDPGEGFRGWKTRLFSLKH